MADSNQKYESKDTLVNGRPKPSVQKSRFVASLWEAAVAKTLKISALKGISIPEPADLLQNVCTEAGARKDEVVSTEKKVKIPGKSGKEVKVREAYGSIVSCVRRFQDVGDFTISLIYTVLIAPATAALQNYIHKL